MTPGRRTKNERIALISAAFSPAAPVDSDLWADRPDQVFECIKALFQRGLHIALYGERGVGKTSLANVLPKIIRGAKHPDLNAVRIDCNTQDTFRSIWRKVFRELGRPVEQSATVTMGPHGDTTSIQETLEPEDVRRLLQKTGRTLIVIDELDRMDDNDGLSLLADTVKTLSDHAVEATLMLVGVADSLVALLGEHESIVRCLVQVHMPRMSYSELESIIDKGMERAELTIQPDAKHRIISFAEGLPHFVHLIGLRAGERVVEDDRYEITVRDIDSSMETAVDSHAIRNEYHRATHSPQPGHLYKEVLLACAYASRDDLGFFRAGDVREPLSLIVGREMPIASFQRHLTELSGSNRNQALQRDGQPRRYRFRFRNPLLQPFTKIRALAKGMITEEKRQQLEAFQNNPSRPASKGGR